MTAVAPPSMSEEMLARIVFYGPDDLLEMIEIVDEAERFIRLVSADFVQRTTSGELQQMTSQDRERMSVIVRGELSGRSHNGIKWLEKMRLYLKEEREDYENEQRGCAVLRFRDKHLPLEVPTPTSDVQESINEEKDQGELVFLAPQASARRHANDHAAQAISPMFDSAGKIIRGGDWEHKLFPKDHDPRNTNQFVLAMVLYMVALVVLWYFFGQWWIEL